MQNLSKVEQIRQEIVKKVCKLMQCDRVMVYQLVEDSDEDFVAFERVARKLSITNPIYRCCDGEDALEFL